MDSPGMYSDSPIDAEDAVYPCKGCGEILEEGKAFELAGNRWHIDCFRCNTCKTLLDSDANLLLLGDGSLICNNCTYSCSACGNKIEDLAILTGDQAFCASCFKCRNCKRKIENLRYARTSQGIFCMTCHESLMARRRKKSKQSSQSSRVNSSSGPGLDKSLPALPPSMASQPQFATPPGTGTGTPPNDFYSDSPSAFSPRPQSSSRRQDGSTGPPTNRTASPAGVEDGHRENLTLPASTYADDRRSFISRSERPRDGAGGDEDFFIPMTLDPVTAPGPSPMTSNNQFQTQKASNRLPSGHSQRDALESNDSRSSSVDRMRRDASYNKAPVSPHIAYQQKGRQPSSDYLESKTRRDMSMDSSPATDGRAVQSPSSSAYTSHAPSPKDFKLQEAPKARGDGMARKLSKKNPNAPRPTDFLEEDVDDSDSSSPTSVGPSRQPPPEPRHVERPARGDSLERPARGDSLAHGQARQTIARKEVGSDSDHASAVARQPSHKRNTSAASSAPRGSQEFAHLSVRKITKSDDADSLKGALDAPSLPARSTSRPSAFPAGGDSFTAPRAPPPPPPTGGHKNNESISTSQGSMSAQMSPSLPRYSTGENFSMEEEMGRIMKGEQMDEKDSAMMRKVSNAAKHMRSFSDRGGHSASKQRDHKFVRSPGGANGSVDLGSLHSPTSATADGRDDLGTLKYQLRRMQKRNAELEAEKNHYVEVLNSNESIQAVNEDLKQKRSTMAFLDTQREIVVRELEVMTEHLKIAKDSNQPLDITSFKSNMMRDFGASMQSLKNDISREIESLIHQRNQVTNEIADLIQMKDRGNQEYEDLSHRNQQLTHLNSELVAQIQKMYEAGSDKSRPRPPLSVNGMNFGAPLQESRSTSSNNMTGSNGLGIYGHQSQPSVDPARSHSHDPSMQTLVNEDMESAVMTAPHVVNIRKGRPNMWKKGSQAVAKNIRGIKGAFASERAGYGPAGQMTEGTPYGSLQEGGRPGHNEPVISGPMNVRKGDPGFWTQEKGRKPLRGPTSLGIGMSNGSATNVTGDIALFGSDLSQRCQAEKRDIPNIVLSCIQEVELRGMDVEGVYRKSGGSGQVNAVRQGFEKDNDYDVSDPDLDIHAVTSCLKQYFRRLPVPLITFDAYDGLLDAAQLSDPDKKLDAMRASVEALPKAHRDVLCFLVFHLARVMACEPQNLMSSLNLAVVFAPTIMRPQQIEREMTDMQAQRMAVQTLLENHQIVFSAL